MRTSLCGCVAAALLGSAAVCSAFYTNIVVDGQFDDWSAVPAAATDASGDNDTGPDLATLQIANDESNVYLRVTYHTAVNPNAGPSVMLALDSDLSLGTGFDIFGLLVVGSEAGWQNDFPFQQTNGNFNSGSISGGAAVIAPFFAVTTNQEYAISLSATYDSDGSPLFPGSTFRLMVYTDPTTANELIGPVLYTLSPRVEAAAFNAIVITNVFVLRITNSNPIATYKLESGPAPSPTNWTYAGYQAEGNGGDIYLYDPSGPATTRVYRVIAEY